jgi:Flp pilus assembly protein TadD
MQDPLRIAFEHHRQGRLDEAALPCERVLPEQPGHIEALHPPGVVANRQGDHGRAVALIGRAVAGNPDNPVYHANLAEAYRMLGRLDEARACCRSALRLRPDFAEAANSLGLVFLAQNQTQAAAERTGPA